MVRALHSSEVASSSTGRLTGLPNRRSMAAQVGELVPAGRPYVAVMRDTDHFQRLNDTYGHETGEPALRV